MPADASEGLNDWERLTALRHISAELAPSEKQVRYLDHLAVELGYRDGREFVQLVSPTSSFSRIVVHNAIDWAKARLESLDTTAHQRRPKRYQAPG